METKRQPDSENAISQCVAAGVRNPHLRKAVEEIVPKLIYPAELLHGAVEGVEALGLDHRATLGFDWPWISRVVLLITDRRLLELSLRPMGRELEGRVRTFAWSMVTAVSCDRRRLVLSSRNGGECGWELRSPLSSAALRRLKESAAPLGEAFGGRVCDRCGSAAFSGGNICSGCNARVVDPREVASYGWTVPGAGLMMTRHQVLGAGRLIIELIAALAFGLAVLTSGSAMALAAVVVGAAIILLLIKLESVRIARLVAARSGVGMRWSERLWSGLRAPMAVLSIALLAAPLFFVGSMETRISADLDFIVPDQLWNPTQERADLTNSHPRSVWSHRDGWTVTVAAEALEPFVGFDEARLRLEDVPGADIEPLQVANFEGCLVIGPAPTADSPERTTRLEFHVFDRSGRDVHTLATLAPASAISLRATEVRNLLRHAVWTDTRDVVWARSSTYGKQ